MSATYSDTPFRTRSLPEDGCGWVVTMTDTRGWRGGSTIVRKAGGIYRPKDYAQSLCRNPHTVAALVVWNVENARRYFDEAAKFGWLDATSMADLAYYFGTNVSRKLLNKEK